MVPIVKVIRPSGNLDSIQANHLRQEIKDILVEKVDILLIDLEDIKFMDSSGLAAIVLGMKMLKEVDAQLFICSINEQVKMLFELTRIDSVLNICSNREEFNRLLVAKQKVSA
ncbi:MAG: STAS domain-containing protein [Scytonematopsis contorta HA4267-MV1]|jgi:anti-anti-sigma factor|nr:STAS domain-containing protein [Scytonematopsis contorta HA4267-MV1]